LEQSLRSYSHEKQRAGEVLALVAVAIVMQTTLVLVLLLVPPLLHC
jgi:hypothetical protein